MRILHVVPSYMPAWRYGGPIKSVHGLCKGLAARGHDVHVFTTNIDGPGYLDVPVGTPVDIEGVKVWYFASKYLRRLYWAPDMGRALKHHSRSFDVLHTHSVFLWPTTAAARIARRLGIPYVIAPRGMLVADLIKQKSGRIKKAWIALFERTNLAKANLVHFTSTTEAEDAAQLGLTFNAICIVPNGLHRDEMDSGLSLASLRVDPAPDNGGCLLFIGRIVWKKGLDRLITALPLVPNCRLVIAGNDEERYQPKLEALAVQLGVRERVRFVGPVYGADKIELLKRASALVLPSYSENFGNVVLEAMAVGCPVIVTPEVGAADIVRQSGGGVVLEGDPQTLGIGIKRLLSDPTTLKRMGRRARDAITSQYTWDAIAAEMEQAYRGIISH